MSDDEKSTAIGTWSEWRHAVFAELKARKEGQKELEQEIKEALKELKSDVYQKVSHLHNRHTKLDSKVTALAVKVGLITSLLSSAGTWVASKLFGH